MNRTIAKISSPYVRLGLTRNPFGELSSQERAELAIVDVAGFLSALTDSFCVLQFLGGCGYGKTTHLLALYRAYLQRADLPPVSSEERPMPARSVRASIEPPESRKRRFSVGWQFANAGSGGSERRANCDYYCAIDGAGWIQFPEGGPRPRLPASRPLFVDEAQRMSRLQKWELARGSGPLILGSHEDLTPVFKKRYKIASIQLEMPKTARQVAAILNRRVDASRTGNHTSFSFPALSESFCESLLDRFGSNLRIIEEHLYDALQNLVMETGKWPPAI